jgi:chromosome segregation ATPase
VSFLTGLFIVVLAGILAGTIAEIAKAIARRGVSSIELANLKQQIEQHTAALEDVESTVADQAAQLAELHERVDFAERLLAQARDRPALGAGQKRG